MTALVTGSRIYGTPNEQSDIDLVVLVTEKDLELLVALADPDPNIIESMEYGVNTKSRCLRFGKLNLLCTWDQEDYDVWVQGTDELERRKPVTRQEAVNHFSSLRNRLGV